jgi:NAD-dependent deacetylase
MDHETSEALGEIRGSLGRRTRVAVLTGAGISAASGIPTFRGAADSLWENHRPEELATPEAFHRNPELVWRWYDWRRGLIAQARPNAAHRALVELADRVGHLTLITQNVDGLHTRAGSRSVLEFHGSIWKLRCLDCRREALDERVPLPIPPRCEACGGLLRPGVVWFGEAIDPVILRDSAAAAQNCDLFLVVGTSGAVYPAASLAALAGRSGARVLEFNLERSALADEVDLFIPGSADLTLPGLVP